ncbi:MAG: DUF2232 domain-containing protein [Aristaeellaceae bacterium]
MPRAKARAGIADALILLAAAVLPFLSPWLAAAAYLTPVLAECCRAGGRPLLAPAAAAVMSVAAYLAGAPVQLAALGGAWALAAVAMALLPRLDAPLRRTVAWTAVAAAMAGAGLTLMRLHYGGTLCQGLAEDAVAWIAAREDAPDLLLTGLKLGYARVEGAEDILPVFQLFGRTVMFPELKAELLGSLRTTLAYALRELIPSAAVVYMAAVALLSAWLPDLILRLRGRAALLPPMAGWFIPREYAAGAILLALFGLVRYLTGSLAVYQAGVMSMTAFYLLYGVQGLCLAIWWLRRGQLPPGAGLLLGMLALSMLPMAGMVLVLLGAVDQLADPRGLRETDDTEI